MLIKIDTNISYFGIPRYFFRGSFTSATTGLTMVYVQWINFTLSQQNNHTFIGYISLVDWNNWPTINPITLNPFIYTTTLRPSRYALAYEAIKPGIVYVDMAFIPLDSENLSEANHEAFSNDFGDNRFPYFLGNSNVRLQDNQQDIEDDSAVDLDDMKDFASLKSYIPESVLRFLTKP